MAASSVFPHQKLDWTIHRLEERLQQDAHDSDVRLELARAVLSRGLFHSQGTGEAAQARRETSCAQALAAARKVLGEDPGTGEALALAGLALIGMDRPEAARKYLDQAVALDARRADLQLGLGLIERGSGNLGKALRHFEAACREAPEAWETHLYLGRALMQAAHQQAGTLRLLERGQYHLVQALKLGPPPAQTPPLLKDLGVSCLLTGRHREAERFFIRLREHEDWAPIARFHLGQVAYSMGKYHNAITHFRQFLRDKDEDPEVLSRIALAWFQLGDYRKARESCHQALLIDPTHIGARHALGCTLLEEGDSNEALKTFREALKEAPEHLPSYIEMARARRLGGDTDWLIQALEVEVGQYDRLPPGKLRGTKEGARIEPRSLTRERVRVVLEELRAVGPATTPEVLRAIHRTQDEALRFQLWEAACAMAATTVADEAAAHLRQSGRTFGPQLGAVALAAASALPEPVLTGGLRIEDADLKRAAVDRYPPAHDVTAHRQNLDRERQKARAYQALILLAVASRRSPAGKQLLRDWATTADPELAAAAWAGLALYGDAEAVRQLKKRARERGAPGVVERLLVRISPPKSRAQPRRVSQGEETTCTTCGRATAEASHMITGGDVVMCNHCVAKVSQERATLGSPDDAACRLCGRTHFEARGLYRLQKVDICNHCVQLSLGLQEREEINEFLANW